jgi:succinate dehydrogenase flavin-adding protein (antitoxin of CptAB toxin-antitoxin module)
MERKKKEKQSDPFDRTLSHLDTDLFARIMDQKQCEANPSCKKINFFQLNLFKTKHTPDSPN